MMTLKTIVLGPILGSVLLLTAPGLAVADDRPLTMDAYCELTKRLYQLSELELKDRLAVAEELRDDKKRVQERFESLRQQYQSVRAKLYANFETSSAAFGQFAHENRDSVAAHLEENPTLRNEIEGLKSHVRALADRIESSLSRASGGEK